MQNIEVTYYPHCDDGSCDLGSADWRCPECDGYNTDYDDLWWDQHEEDGHTVKSECEHCKATFAFKKIDYGEFEIKPLPRGAQ